MDPQANLEEQRCLAARITAAYDSDSAPRHEDVARLAGLVQTLDEWITGGGFLPPQWRIGPHQFFRVTRTER